MAEMANPARHEFWRPPAPEKVVGHERSETCEECRTEFIVGSRYCHCCGASRPERSTNRAAEIPGLTEFTALSKRLGLATASLIAFLFGIFSPGSGAERERDFYRSNSTGLASHSALAHRVAAGRNRWLRCRSAAEENFVTPASDRVPFPSSIISLGRLSSVNGRVLFPKRLRWAGAARANGTGGGAAPLHDRAAVRWRWRLTT